MDAAHSNHKTQLQGHCSIALEDVYANGSVIDVMLELCSGGSLSDYIDSNFVKCGGYGGARTL